MHVRLSTSARCAAGLVLVIGAFTAGLAQEDLTRAEPKPVSGPWMNTALDADQRADLALKEMTQAEKLQLVIGTGRSNTRAGMPLPADNMGGAGYVPGIKRLGIPSINLADSAVGVNASGQKGRYSTLLPSTLGAAASWDAEGARLYGSVIGRELRAQGYNMSIGGGVNLMREPRNGRNFEYAGEDPLLAGVMTGNLMKGVAGEQVMSDIKHYAFNDQETGRTMLSVVMDKKQMRESDLLAFQVAIGIAHPSAVMCSYNKINGDYACENDYLLNQVLKKDWNFKGWVVSDWNATHSTTKAALAGLDMEQPGQKYFNENLAKAIASGEVPQARLDDMVHRILRSMFAAGVIDNPPVPFVPDPFQGRDDAQRIAEESFVLLRNQGNVLPLKPSLRSIVLIGGHADVGVLSGGGSAQVDPPGGNATHPHVKQIARGEEVYFPSSPLKEIARRFPQAKVTYIDGADHAGAAAAAKAADIAIVFTTQPMSEGHDAASSSLPHDQDGLVNAVGKANPATIVVIESGGPVTMPWSRDVAGIIEAWYPGIGGAQALGNLISGAVNFSGKLPATFAASDSDLPNPVVPGTDLLNDPAQPRAPGSADVKRGFDVRYPEGARAGYKWFDSEKKTPLYPFGFGLSYTKFSYSGLHIDEAKHAVSFTLKNEGSMAGDEIAQVYVELPSSAGEHFKRLAGWSRVSLAPGQSRNVTVELNPLTMSVFDVEANQFTMPKGEYKVLVGASSRQILLNGTMPVK